MPKPRDLLRERVVTFVEAVIHGELLRPISACRYPLSCSFVGRQLAGPGVTVVMAVDGTGGGAAARVIELSAVHPFAALLARQRSRRRAHPDQSGIAGGGGASRLPKMPAA
jgi:hypothetical protein